TSNLGVIQERALDLLDGPGDLDTARAGIGAVEDRAAAPDAIAVIEDLEPLLSALIARVVDEAVGVDDGRRSDPRRRAPGNRASRRASGAHDALGGVVEDLAFLGRLQPLAAGGRLVVDQVWLDGLVALPEGLHVDDQVLDDIEAQQ